MAPPRTAEREILVGGQAVLEGVMMKLPDAWAVSVRRPDGSLATRAAAHVPWSRRWPALRWPLLRGVATMGQMLGLGWSALAFSADVLEAEAGRQETGAAGDRPPPSGVAGTTLGLGAAVLLQALTNGPEGDERDAPGTSATARAAGAEPPRGARRRWDFIGAIAVSIVLFVVLFKALPLLVAAGVGRLVPALATPFYDGLISGAALLAVFVGYLAAISRLPDIKRLFQYHGAEHQVVHVSEAGEPETAESARRHPTAHPRCGTSFLFFVVVTSVVIWSLLPADVGLAGKLGLRLLALPLVVGLSFELIRFTARHRRSLPARVLMAPGLWSQRITARRPDDDMLAVSFHSLALARAASADAGSTARD